MARSLQSASRQVAVVSPGQRLAPAPATYVRDAVVLVGLSIVGSGVLQLTGIGWLTIPSVVVSVLLAVLIVVHGRRAAERGRTRDLLVESLAPYITVGRDLDRRLVRLRGQKLPPREVQVRYAPAVADDQPNWLPTITGTLSRRLGSAYKLDKHDRGRCLLRFVPDDEARSRSPEQERIDKALKSLIGASVKITGFEVDASGQATRISGTHAEPTKAAVDGFRKRVQTTFGKMLPGRWRAHWDLNADSFVFEQRPHLPTNIWLPVRDVAGVDQLVQTNYRLVTIAFGVNEDGVEMCWAPAIQPHLLMSGTTGSGKTSTTHAIVGTVTRWGWPVWVLDGKRIEFLAFRTWPNVQIVASTIEQQVALIRRVVEVVEYRYRLIEEGRVKPADFEPLLVVPDEDSGFVATLLAWYPTVKMKGDPTRPPSLGEAASLVRTARVARVHLVSTMQRPDVALFGDRAGGETRSNFPQRISMGRLDMQAAMMMWGLPHIGVTIPRAVGGRATAIDDKGNPVETQCYRFPALDAEEGTEEYQLLQRLRPAKARHPRLLIVPPEVQKDLDNSEVIQLTFEDYANAKWVFADERPELDPVRMAAAQEDHPDDQDWARRISSPLASLGLHPGLPQGTRRPPIFGYGGGGASDQWSTYPDDALDGDVGYGDQLHLDSPYGLDIGDLLQVDAEDDSAATVWVTVDESPEPDPSDPSMVLVSWRGDDDSSGVLLLPGDEPVTVRKAQGLDRSSGLSEHEQTYA